jgi:thioredoxin reductase
MPFSSTTEAVPITMTTSTNGVERDIYDITIIGAGPTGLFAAFYAGMRKARTQIIDSLEEPGGALTAIYPEKYIYDVAGFPKILAKDLVEQMYQQAMRDEPDVHLSEQVLNLERLDDGILQLTTSKAVRYSKSVIICGGVGAFEPKRLEAPGVEELTGKGIHYFAKRVEDFRDKRVVIVGGGDSAVDWALTLEPIAKKVTVIHRSQFRAHESSVQELKASSVDLHFPKCEVTEVHAGDHGRLGAVSFKNGEGEITTIEADELIVAVGFLADLGPLKSWGFELHRNQIVVDIVTMQTNIPGVFAAGDVCWYPAKFRLIATGAAEAVTAVNHAVVHNDPGSRLDPGHSTNIMAAREGDS